MKYNLFDNVSKRFHFPVKKVCWGFCFDPYFILLFSFLKVRFQMHILVTRAYSLTSTSIRAKMVIVSKLLINQF